MASEVLAGVPAGLFCQGFLGQGRQSGGAGVLEAYILLFWWARGRDEIFAFVKRFFLLLYVSAANDLRSSREMERLRHLFLT